MWCLHILCTANKPSHKYHNKSILDLTTLVQMSTVPHLKEVTTAINSSNVLLMALRLNNWEHEGLKISMWSPHAMYSSPHVDSVVLCWHMCWFDMEFETDSDRFNMVLKFHIFDINILIYVTITWFFNISASVFSIVHTRNRTVYSLYRL